jgi:hypothetical protein
MPPKTPITTTPPPAIQPEIEVATASTRFPLIPIVVALLLLAVSAAGYFYFQRGNSIQKELDTINLDSMDSDFQELDAAATGL